MSNKVALISILSLSIFLIACKSGYSPDVQKLHDEVMVIHDEVMPEMGTIHKLKKELKKKLDSEGDNIDEADIQNNIKALDYADEAMMGWMHQFKMPKDQSDDQLLEYLEDQKVKIKKVNLDMKTVIKNAKIANEKY